MSHRIAKMTRVLMINFDREPHFMVLVPKTFGFHGTCGHMDPSNVFVYESVDMTIGYGLIIESGQ